MDIDGVLVGRARGRVLCLFCLYMELMCSWMFSLFELHLLYFVRGRYLFAYFFDDDELILFIFGNGLYLENFSSVAKYR